MSPTIINSDDRVLPKGRTVDLVIQDTGDETLVYDMKNENAHHLNSTMSLIWKYCDGKTNFQEIKDELSKTLKIKVDDDLVFLALSELKKSDLIEEGVEKNEFDSLSRRKVLLKYALPAVAIPMVMSLVTPTNAQMLSCLPEESPCLGNPIACCPGLVCNAFEGNSCDLVAPD